MTDSCCICAPYVKLEWLKKMFINVPALTSNEEIHYVNRDYLLYLLSCTLFVHKSSIMVSVAYLTLLDDLSMAGT